MSQPSSDSQAIQKPEITARRTRLREFQAQLVERMHTARSEGAHANLLGVMMGDSRWLLDLQSAGEIVPIGTITQVPLTQPWFLGLTNIRGNLISVIDFPCFEGGRPTTVDKDSRIVAFGSALSFNSGLLVSRVLGLRNVDEMQPYDGSDDDGGGEKPAWAGRRYLDRDSQVWTELDLSSVIQHPRFLQVGL